MKTRKYNSVQTKTQRASYIFFYVIWKGGKLGERLDTSLVYADGKNNGLGCLNRLTFALSLSPRAPHSVNIHNIHRGDCIVIAHRPLCRSLSNPGTVVLCIPR